ncbi:MAG: 6-carboxytetrahydropterin synthase [Bacteroidota bacterium]|nr:6-carboxytetrahydropterin synthase [Bacteroidota bacterium]
MVYLTRLEHFNAAHKLYNPNWSKEKNEEVFEGCANENWHGHNFDLYVTVKGEVNPETGFVMNLKDLSKIIREHVIKKVDHKNLNLDVDFMQGKMASAEVLIVEIWKILEKQLPQGVFMHALKLYETARSFVEYYGE